MRNAVCVRASLLAVCFACLGGTARADYASAVLALNPSHYWRLNETVEGLADDAIDGVGTINGTHQGFFGEGLGEIGAAGPPVPGLEAGNLAFGANNFASVGLGPGANLAAPTMTVAGWFAENGSEGGDRFWTNNQSDPNTQFQIFFGGGFGDVAASIGIGLNSAINGFPASGLPSGPGVGNFHIPDSTVRVKDGQWHHIVASRNGNNIENVIVVIDGVHYGIDTWRDSTDTWGTTGSDAQIATRTPPDGGPAQQAINGSVDEIAVWLNRQLTVAESIALYQAAVNPPVGLDGDYNGNSVVDAADYVVWRNNLGLSDAALMGNGTGDPSGLVVQADYTLWRSKFGSTGGAGSGALASVPEPSAMILFLLGLIASSGAVRSR